MANRLSIARAKLSQAGYDLRQRRISPDEFNKIRTEYRAALAEEQRQQTIGSYESQLLRRRQRRGQAYQVKQVKEEIQDYKRAERQRQYAETMGAYSRQPSLYEVKPTSRNTSSTYTDTFSPSRVQSTQMVETTYTGRPYDPNIGRKYLELKQSDVKQYGIVQGLPVGSTSSITPNVSASVGYSTTGTPTLVATPKEKVWFKRSPASMAEPKIARYTKPISDKAISGIKLASYAPSAIPYMTPKVTQFAHGALSGVVSYAGTKPLAFSRDIAIGYAIGGAVGTAKWGASKIAQKAPVLLKLGGAVKTSGKISSYGLGTAWAGSIAISTAATPGGAYEKGTTFGKESAKSAALLTGMRYGYKSAPKPVLSIYTPKLKSYVRPQFKAMLRSKGAKVKGKGKWKRSFNQGEIIGTKTNKRITKQIRYNVGTGETTFKIKQPRHVPRELRTRSKTYSYEGRLTKDIVGPSKTSKPGYRKLYPEGFGSQRRSSGGGQVQIQQLVMKTKGKTLTKPTADKLRLRPPLRKGWRTGQYERFQTNILLKQKPLSLQQKPRKPTVKTSTKIKTSPLKLINPTQTKKKISISRPYMRRASPALSGKRKPVFVAPPQQQAPPKNWQNGISSNFKGLPAFSSTTTLPKYAEATSIKPSTYAATRVSNRYGLGALFSIKSDTKTKPASRLAFSIGLVTATEPRTDTSTGSSTKPITRFEPLTDSTTTSKLITTPKTVTSPTTRTPGGSSSIFSPRPPPSFTPFRPPTPGSFRVPPPPNVPKTPRPPPTPTGGIKFGAYVPKTKTRKTKRGLVNFNPKYFASLEAGIFKVKGKPTNLAIKSGLGIRPIRF